MSFSTIIALVVTAVILLVLFRILSGMVRLGLALLLIFLIGYTGYWLYLRFFVNSTIMFKDTIQYILPFLKQLHK